jgi:arylsulfatase A-like enzyme
MIEKFQSSAINLRLTMRRLVQYGPRLIIVATVMCLMTSLVAVAERKPNILIILADDLGYADLGFQGCKDIPTPNLDTLASSGVRFTNGYVSGSWCSPTRAGLLTGRYQERWGHEQAQHALSLSEVTIADRLKAAGYATGIVGKWHLGTSPEHHPQQRGFDEFFGFLRGGHSYMSGVPHIVFPDRTGAGQDFTATEQGRVLLEDQILRGTEHVDEQEYLTDAFAREAVSFIERHKKDPFFLFLSFNAVHTPMHATDDRLEKFASIADPMRRIYAAMTLAMDEAVGRVTDKLRQADLEQDTLIFFCSDNGGPTVQKFAYNASQNTPLRGSKGITLEGGIRVPFVISWKGHLPAGEVYDPQVIQLDFLPTALAAAGVEAKPEWKLDGVNLLPHLKGQASAPPHDVLYWRSIGQMAVRKGDWKLVTYMSKIDEGDILREDSPAPTPHRLYNLSSDIGETNDLAGSETEKFNELKSLWDKWNASMAEVPQGRPANPGASQAPTILRSLDVDKDGKISQGEAPNDMKANFPFIDANGDGGIDVDELTRILKMQSSR